MNYKVFVNNIYGEVEIVYVNASNEPMALWITAQSMPHLDPFKAEPCPNIYENNVIRVDFERKKRSTGPYMA